MPRPPLPLLLWSLPVAASLVPPATQAQPSTRASAAAATVASIGDGDTIRVRQSGRLLTVRLACIDAPEMAQGTYGAQARRSLQARLPPGSTVRLMPHSTDRYGRTVAEVIAAVNLNLALVEDGQAFAYRQYLSGCDARAYLDAEQRASRRRAGVWREPGGITRPWDFRRGGPAGQRPAPGGIGHSLPSASRGSGPTGGRRHRCREIGSYALAQQLLRQGHTYLDGNGDGEACESLRR